MNTSITKLEIAIEQLAQAMQQQMQEIRTRVEALEATLAAGDLATHREVLELSNSVQNVATYLERLLNDCDS